MITYKTAESVCVGHPDKLCDLISDSILDACLKVDKSSRVACEVLATHSRVPWHESKIIVAGEITCAVEIDIRSIVKKTLSSVGYNPRRFSVSIYVKRQSRDISDGVNKSIESRGGDSSTYSLIGAGDQGTVYGYAINESRQLLPLPLVLSHNICIRLDSARRNKVIEGIKPDGKAQVTVEYENDKPVRVKTVVVSIQHSTDKDYNTLRDEIIKEIIPSAFEEFPIDDHTEILINPSGRFVEGGPSADTGLTGRKIMVDTYGGLALHGGGAFSGKDPTKVDRSGAYMARYIAKNIVWSGLAEKCEVALSYAIGKAYPVAVNINSFGTGKKTDEKLSFVVKQVFDLRPLGIIIKLNLLDTTYSNTATYGHFNSYLFPWEDVGMFTDLRKAITLYDNRKTED